MKIKNFVVIHLIAILLIAFTACKDTQMPTSGDSTAVTDPTASETAPTTPTVATEPGHTHIYADTLVAPTCAEDGYVNHVCSCGDTYISDKTAAVGHEFGEWETTKEPTTTATGLAERECASCGAKETKTIGKVVADHTHSYTNNVTQNATCSSEGVQTFTCSCGDSYTEAIAKINHDYQQTIVKPTCTNEGYTTNRCSACGDAYVNDKTSPVGHAFGEWKTVEEPTASATGLAERKCSNCETAESKTLGKLTENHMHSYTSEVTTAATCTKEGVKTYHCDCGDSYTETIAKPSHAYKKTVTKPTCTNGGYTTNKCSDCGSAYVSDKTAAVGHSFGEWETTKAPTTTATGIAERKCVNCSARETRTLSKLVADHTHSYTETVTKKATCTIYGVKTFTCSCGDQYTERIGKTAHQYGENVKKATCTEWGYTTYTCSSCGNCYEDNYTSPLKHSYDAKIVKATCTAGGYTQYTCSRCGNSYKGSERSAIGHSYDTVSETDATCAANGVKKEVCENCGHEKTTTTKALGHTVKTETKDAFCGNDGYVYEYCSECKTELSNTIIPAPSSHKYVARVVADVVKEQLAENNHTNSVYVNCTDWLVDQCEVCGTCTMDDMYFRYTDYEAAVIMLGYVNDLRAKVYGTHDYDLVLDDTLLEWSKIRAKEIVADCSHNGKPLGCGENIIVGGDGIYDDFLGWCNSQGHYANMINKDVKLFGYAFHIEEVGSQKQRYSIQLFKYE